MGMVSLLAFKEGQDQVSSAVIMPVEQCRLGMSQKSEQDKLFQVFITSEIFLSSLNLKVYISTTQEITAKAPNIIIKWVSLLLHIQKIPGSYFGPEANYHD
jgi:hypothetical protein